MLTSALILLQKIVNPDRSIYCKNHDGNDCAKNLRTGTEIVQYSKNKDRNLDNNG